MKRLPQLDGIRGLAIGLVLVSHYFACLVLKEGHPISFISRILTITWSGVDLFFVLSGFLITGILIDNRESSNYYYIFYLRRACRILPLYLLLLLSYVLVTSAGLLDPQTYQFLLEQPHPLWSYFTFTQNILMGLSCSFGPHWLAVTWSLAVEEHFYFVLPWIIKRIAGSKLLYLFGILVLSAPILRYVAHPCLAYLHTLCRTDSIFAGACLALFYRSPELMKRAERNYSKLLVWFGVLSLGVIAIIRWLPNFSNPVNHLWFALLFSLLIFI